MNMMPHNTPALRWLRAAARPCEWNRSDADLVLNAGGLLAAGWGYAASAAALRAATAAPHPATDGLWLMDTRSGSARLLVSLQQLFQATFSGAVLLGACESGQERCACITAGLLSDPCCRMFSNCSGIASKQRRNPTHTGKFSWHKDSVTGLPYHTAVQRGGKASAMCLAWISAAVFSRDGDSLAFTYKVGHCPNERTPTLTFVYTVDIDGKRMWR